MVLALSFIHVVKNTSSIANNINYNMLYIFAVSFSSTVFDNFSRSTCFRSLYFLFCVEDWTRDTYF